MLKYEDIQKVNDLTNTVPIKGKEYTEVHQRIKAFRMLFPEGFIATDVERYEDGKVIFKATAGYYSEDGIPVVLGTGHAEEKEGSTFINETSYVENCETSAIGRCLASIGIGINDSVASYEEVANAKANQKGERKASEKQIAVLQKVYTGDRLKKLLETNELEKLEDISMSKASDLIGKLKKAEEKNG